MIRLTAGSKESSPDHGEKMVQEAALDTRRGLTAQGQQSAKAASVTFSLFSDCTYNNLSSSQEIPASEIP